MPRSIHLLALGIFTMVTSEFAVSGLMPQMSEGLGVGIPQIGYLVTLFALAMSIGGPLLATLLFRFDPRRALLILFALFLIGNALAAAAPNYEVIAVARVITGAASGAFFGVAVTAAVALAPESQRARAIGTAIQGLMLGTALGLPLATLIGGLWGWRGAFVAIGALTVVSALAMRLFMPVVGDNAPRASLRAELGVFRNLRLWGVMATSTLIIGAAFAGFSYFAPILAQETGVPLAVIPLLLLAYGAVTVVGNAIVARLASDHTMTVLVWGTTLSAAFLAVFALAAHIPALAITAMLGIGLVGVTMNPAMVTRVQRVGNAGALVNTVHSSMITFGVVLGSAIGGIGIELTGVRAPLWVGSVLAVIAVLVMLPALGRAVAGRRAAEREAALVR